MGLDAPVHHIHTKRYATLREFSAAMLNFLRENIPRNRHAYCDQVTDNFRIFDPTEFRITA